MRQGAGSSWLMAALPVFSLRQPLCQHGGYYQEDSTGHLLGALIWDSLMTGQLKWSKIWTCGGIKFRIWWGCFSIWGAKSGVALCLVETPDRWPVGSLNGSFQGCLLPDASAFQLAEQKGSMFLHIQCSSNMYAVKETCFVAFVFLFWLILLLQVCRVKRLIELSEQLPGYCSTLLLWNQFIKEQNKWSTIVCVCVKPGLNVSLCVSDQGCRWKSIFISSTFT